MQPELTSQIEQKAIPVFRRLSEDESRQVLSRNHVGRVANSFHDRLDIELVQYVYSEGWIYGRTTREGTSSAVAHNPWVAFEVDESTGLFDWCSVVVKGTFERLEPAESGIPDLATAHGMDQLRALISDARVIASLPPSASVQSHREFRLFVGEISGRGAHDPRRPR